MNRESLAFLKRLLEMPSPGGYEAAIQEAWCAYVAPYAEEIRARNQKQT